MRFFGGGLLGGVIYDAVIYVIHRHSSNKMDLQGQKNSNTIAVGTKSLTRYSVRPIGLSKEVTNGAETLLVDDGQTRKRFVIMIQHVDFRQIRTPIQNGIVRFTERENTPSISGDILLRTPGFYRKKEGGDRLDSAKEADLAPYFTARLGESGILAGKDKFTAQGLSASSDEPWILCTSIKPSHPAGATSLENQFSGKGPDAMATTVNDIGAFATQLGIDVAQSAELKRKTKDSVFDIIGQYSFRLACGVDKEINAIVNVIHSPVHYVNETLTVQTGDDIAEAGPHRIIFTKRTRFTGEQEYRFAVSAGCPTSDTIRLSLSPELSRLTKSWRYGDRWWES